MLAYITIGTNDFQRAVNFYDAIFNVLGYSRLPAWTDSWAMWGNENHPDDEFSFCICPPFDQQPATAGNGTMFAFRANSAEIVRRFHAAGLRAGGKDEGVPGTRTAYGTLYTILCKCLFSEVTVQAVTELDNKAAHCHTPVPQRHRPFL